MSTKRLTIELATDQYELLQKQAKAEGTTVTGMIRRLIDEFRFRVPEEVRKKYQIDPIYQRRGSFDGPQNLAEDHDHYLYGRESQ
jgi:hypothetical protein